MLKTTIMFLLSVLAVAAPVAAFNNGGLAILGKPAIAKTAEQVTTFGPTQRVGDQAPRQKDVTVVKNYLREIANWNDVWDDYGMYGGYGRGGYGGLRLRRDVPSRDVSSLPVRSGSDVWRDDFVFPYRSYGGGYGYGGETACFMFACLLKVRRETMMFL